VRAADKEAKDAFEGKITRILNALLTTLIANYYRMPLSLVRLYGARL